MSGIEVVGGVEQRAGGPLRKFVTIEELATNYPDVVSSPRRGWAMVREQILPPGVVVRLGRQVRINVARFEAWLASGGAALSGGWRRAKAASEDRAA